MGPLGEYCIPSARFFTSLNRGFPSNGINQLEYQESWHHCATISPPPNTGRIFNSSFSLYYFQFTDNLIILIDDHHFKVCWGTLQRLICRKHSELQSATTESYEAQNPNVKRCQDVSQDFIKPCAFFQSTLNSMAPPYLTYETAETGNKALSYSPGPFSTRKWSALPTREYFSDFLLPCHNECFFWR